MEKVDANKPVLTIVCYNQFGYLTDTFEYCKFLKDTYEIHYLCIDYGQEKQVINGVDVHYFQTNKTGTKKWLSFLSFALKTIPKNTSVLFVKYFLFSSVLGFKYRSIANLDVRTGSVKAKNFPRFIENALISIESRAYKYRTIISDSLASKIIFPPYKVISLGANIKDLPDRTYQHDGIKLLYIGTLSGRNIDQVVIGLDLFVKSNPTLDIKFDIVGDGYNNEVETLKSLVSARNLEELVTVHGRVPYQETSRFFEAASIGVSYVPKTSFFDVQPVTKTFEYLGAGLPVIATSTSEQLKVINKVEYGQTCEDTPESFKEALERCVNNSDIYRLENIIEHAKNWSWDSICGKVASQINEIYQSSK